MAYLTYEEKRIISLGNKNVHQPEVAFVSKIIIDILCVIIWSNNDFSPFCLIDQRKSNYSAYSTIENQSNPSKRFRNLPISQSNNSEEVPISTRTRCNVN